MKNRCPSGLNLGRILVVLLLMLAPASTGFAAGTNGSVKSILILNSYHQGFAWADGQLEGLREGLGDTDLHIDLSVEYMDILRQKAPFDYASFTDYLKWRLAGREFDLIVTTDNAALAFVEENYGELFQSVPVVFSDADGVEQMSFPPGMEITGIREFEDFGSTIDFALELRPNTRKIVVFGDTRDIGAGPAWASKYFQSIQSDIPVEIHLDKSFEEIKDIASRLGPEDIFFSLAVAYDSEGVLHSYNPVRRNAAATSRAPSFSFWSTGVVDGGSVGGKMNTPAAQGHAAAGLAIRILNGEDASTIPFIPAPMKYIFDYPSLKRHGLSLSNLPEGSTILNKPHSVYEDYKAIIWMTLAALIGLVCAVFILLFNIRKRKAAEIALAASRDNLEDEVAERTTELVATNESLSETLHRLERTQEQLIESEKMAALGGLVSGVAHEINTPLGVSLTAASYFEESARALNAAYETGELGRDRFERFLADASQTANIVRTNLDRAATLIRSFKQVAVDQSNEVARAINLKDYLETTVKSLMPELKAGRHTVEINCPDDILIETYPGIIAQILGNLVMNSARHGFDSDRTGGIIQIDGATENGKVTLSYRDDGRGMTGDVLKSAFEPFFTTARGKGGSGLGLSIVYNLVTHKLKGQLTCESSPGQGVLFVITLPEHGVVADAVARELRHGADQIQSPIS